jgi:4-amino-4-deoxy-L-arabinose transferase-like glycosyltransferase
MNRRLEALGFVLVLSLAATLRLGWPGLTEFKLDEARAYSLALQLVEFRGLPLAATDMSVGLPNSPLTIYIYALPMFLWKSPLAPMLFGALLNTAAVALAYALVRRYWGPRAALFSALLYAAAPWAVLYSRKIWASNLLPLFMVGYVFSGLLAFVEGRRRWVLAHLVLLSVIVQIHISSAALGLVTLALLWVYRRRVDWRLVGIGVAGAALLEVPFVIYLLTRASNFGAAGSVMAGRSLQITGDVFQLAAMLVEGTFTHSLAGSQYLAFDATLPDFTLVFWLGGALALAGAGLVVYRAWRERRSGTLSPAAQAGLMLLAWLVAPLAFFVAHVSPVYPHYLTIFMAVSFALSGVLLDGLWGRGRAGGLPVLLRVLAVTLPLVVAGCQTWQVLALYNYVGTQATPGAFGVPLEKLLQAADAARGAGAPEVLVVSEGADAWNDNSPAVFDVLLHGMSHRFVDGRTTAVMPEGEAAVILWPGDFPSRNLYQQWGGGQWLAEISLRQGEGMAYVAKGQGALPVPHLREASALLSNGAELLGSGGSTAHWELWWRAPGPAEGEDFQVFAHLLDATGAKLAQVDEATFGMRAWRPGDVVVNFFALGQGGASVRAGMYAYPSLTPASVLDAAGNPAGDWLIFPLTQ